MTLPTYTIDETQFAYEPRAGLTSLCWYNIANCARKRMRDAHFQHTDKDPDAGFLLWKRERETFWTLTRKSIPDKFV